MSPASPFWLMLAVFTATGLCALSAYIWRSRATEGGGSLVVLILAVAASVLASGTEHVVATLEPKLWLAKLGWVPTVAIPITAFVVAAQATARHHWVTSGRIGLLSLPAAAMVLLVVSNDLHGWVWASATLNFSTPYPDLELVHGSAFWVWIAYSYGLLAVAAGLLIRKYVQEWPRSRDEAFFVGLAILVPWATNVWYVVSERGQPALDLTPYAFSVTAICLSIAMWRGNGILNVVRVARSQILDEMGDGALVVDARERLIYANLAARRALGLDEVIAPVPTEDVLANHPDLMQALDRGRLDSQEVAIQHTERGWRTYDMRVTTLHSFEGTTSSRVLVLRDVTEARRAASSMRDSEILLRKVIDLVPHMVFAKDQRGELLLANRNMVENERLRAGRITGGGPARERSRQFERMLEEDREVVRTGRSIHHGAVRWLDPDGEMITYEVSKIPFTEPSTGEPAMLGIAIDVTERRQAEEKIRKLAYYDTLTGLPNRQRFRTLLENALESTRRGDRRAALLFLDLDRFKQVNDRLGHELGDSLLRTVADRLRECVRMGDAVVQAEQDQLQSTVSRLGGDEFTILLTDIGDPLDAAVAAARIIEALGSCVEIGGHEVQTGASVGIAIYPDDAEDADALFRHADQAMYDAKNRGRNRYAFFRPEMTEASERRAEIEAGLQHALDDEELALHYQLLRHAHSGHVVGVEALLRWTHPELGPVAPREFVEVAEDSGLIVLVGEWVLRAACEQARAWREAGLTPIPISVNVSGHQLHHPGFVETLTELLEETGMSPAQLELDIVESTLMNDDDTTRSNLNGLKELGVSFTLDDFGTGYSSLSYLRQFPVDCVKLDRTFVQDLATDEAAQGLTRGIMGMCHGLGIRVVAEGVETWAQLEFLRDAGCDAVQGHLIGEAMPAADLTHFLRSEKTDGDDAD